MPRRKMHDCMQEFCTESLGCSGKEQKASAKLSLTSHLLGEVLRGYDRHVRLSKCSHCVLVRGHFSASSRASRSATHMYCDTTIHNVPQAWQRDTSTIVTETNRIANNSSCSASQPRGRSARVHTYPRQIAGAGRPLSKARGEYMKTRIVSYEHQVFSSRSPILAQVCSREYQR